ncbi:tripartite tricarboxylate transporter substrate binding protein [Variovorax sp. PCZ-1]|uniref:tripartite tricarboxylate transporter substrate binding protein n=1 Tax=Variovorax sp. PCZ-1 TaxID=2835533 RepID=UPI001BD0AFAF|nr:tripartite tricarboxylate transporter substrate binding protein [Variovorax sp. PCZ-1]MBS7806636.1 tripartite tricarboxylate transporter substrate binding protein [Variovorax sp. PCZ-1]
MRRDQFIYALLAASLPLALRAQTLPTLKMMIPANPGGGWDSTGRALGLAFTESKLAQAVQYENRGGAAGAIGLAQFISASKGDPNALVMMGAVMLGGLITSKAPVSITQCTPIARLTSEYNVFVVPANSPFKSMKDIVDAMKKDMGSVKFGGGSRGSTEHIAACMMARAAGMDPKKVNYVPFRGGGEAVAAIISGNVSVGGSGYSEFAEHIQSGKMRALGVTSDKRIKGINGPTLKEQGINVTLGNWRGLYAAPGITPEQQASLIALVSAASKSASWQNAMTKNGWTPAFMSGKEFADFVDYEFTSLRAIMYLSGML